MSSTLKGIYFLRYLLFSTGLAAGVAVVVRLLSPEEPRPWTSLGTGFALGLVLFRGQLRPLRFPRLALSQDTLYVLRRGKPLEIRWTQVREVKATGDSVEVAYDPGQAPNTLRLKARELGMRPEVLAGSLGAVARDATVRGRLPEERWARASLGIN
jgi:hypothetical protein